MPAGPGEGSLTVHVPGDERPVATLPASEVELQRDEFRPGSLPLFKRLHLVPEVKRLAVIAPGGDRITLYNVDPMAALEKSGVNYLFVVSQAPAVAYRGRTYRYPIQTKSKAGGVQFRVAAGPKGLQVSEAGEVVWKVPALSPTTKEVSIVVTDRSKQEVTHTFKIHVQAYAPPAGKTPADKGPGAGGKAPKGPDAGARGGREPVHGPRVTRVLEIGEAPTPGVRWRRLSA
jgi:hypothetical protein